MLQRDHTVSGLVLTTIAPTKMDSLGAAPHVPSRRFYLGRSNDSYMDRIFKPPFLWGGYIASAPSLSSTAALS